MCFSFIAFFSRINLYLLRDLNRYPMSKVTCINPCEFPSYPLTIFGRPCLNYATIVWGQTKRLINRLFIFKRKP